MSLKRFWLFLSGCELQQRQLILFPVKNRIHKRAQELQFAIQKCKCGDTTPHYAKFRNIFT